MNLRTIPESLATAIDAHKRAALIEEQIAEKRIDFENVISKIK